MKKKRLLWQIFPPMVVVTVAAVIGTTFYASKILRQFYLDQTTADLKVRTYLVMGQLQDDFVAGNRSSLVRRCHEMADRIQTRITLISANGEVLADSVEEPIRMDNHADRPEVAEALRGSYGTAIRLSRTLGKNMLYAALPVYADAQQSSPHTSASLSGVVRLSIPLVSVDAVLNRIYRQNFLRAFILLLLAAVITLFVSRKISRPLEEIGRVAERYGELDFDKKIVFSEKAAISREVAGLAESIGKMATELRERIDTVTKQKNELEAVFKSMVEGVIVVDTEERIVRANDTIRHLFNLSANQLIGRSVFEVCRDADLFRFIQETLAGNRHTEQDLIFRQAEGERHFHASGSLLDGGTGRKRGALVVLNDITKTKKLENIRREFVANVSHELKTPITSIKGFVETLLDGALDDKQDAKQFLEIINKQANRLDDIVEDLLSLSRIEQEEQGTIELEEHALRPVLENCLESCAMKAREKTIAFKLDCPPQLTVAMNRNLLEQAVTNLVVNAIKYSQEKSEVELNAYQQVDKVSINVIDQGCGIARRHLPRLFERFYRSDKARSRKLGGTGLGLAIVKHIVQAHGGDIKVQSEPGKGSTFSIILPAVSGRV